ncbi:MAG TPA: class I SAM-dependent methyltransferase [Anaeromyxobacteraceae bacterium]|nr:class I SAM-dependent methyltransferase [Anaeromyxobacteraceae bacterium]
MNRVEYDVMASVEDAHWWWRARREIVEATIGRYAPARSGRPLAICEVGCGTGGNLPSLAALGTVRGAEASPDAVRLLLEKHGDRFQVIEHELPADLPERYDVLCLLDVLEHVKDDAEAARWLARNLSPGGIAVVTVPAFDAFWSGQDEAARHYRRYTPAAAAALVPPELELVHLSCFNTILAPAILVARAVMRLLRRADPAAAPGSHLGVPPRPINELLYRVFRVERHVAPRRRLPVGVSILLVVRRPTR